MNCDFSLGVFPGSESRKRIVDTRMLSKYAACWNSRTSSRCAGRRVIKRSRTPFARSRGNGCDAMKLFVLLGTEEDEENARLYEEELPLNSNGLLCGELYSAIISIPRLNMSAAGVILLSMTKSGEE